MKKFTLQVKYHSMESLHKDAHCLNNLWGNVHEIVMIKYWQFNLIYFTFSMPNI